MSTYNPIPVIDLFAGPGGLGEGFMSVNDERDSERSFFDIKLSIEKDKNAHQTLAWRSYYRLFRKNQKEVSEEFYRTLKINDFSKRDQEIRRILHKTPQGQEALKEAQCIELRDDDALDNKIDNLISQRLSGHKDWVLIGGPPCQAYSNAGRSRVGGINPGDHRVFLYKQYLRIIRVHQPAIFVMENVKGLLSAKIDGETKIFDLMKKDLELGGRYNIHSLVGKRHKDSNYIDSDYIIHSEKYGVPQMRHRVILLGIRNDYSHNGEYLKESPEVTLESVIGQLPKIRSGLNRTFVGYDFTSKDARGKPKRIYKSEVDSEYHWSLLMKKNIDEIKGWKDIPLNGLEQVSLQFKDQVGGEFLECRNTISDTHPLRRWFSDRRLNGVLNHESRTHLTQDLMRYLFASLYVQKHKTFPRLSDFAAHNEDLLPDHENVLSNKFVDRFRVQLPNKPATTVTCHISKDGHYFIHYDPAQCRSLTVREAARIQTFPDNYLFCGSRTMQYQQVGNAVPPYLSKQIAEIVKEIILKNKY